MQDLLREKHRLEKSVRYKDTQIENLKREKRDYISKIEELEAKLVSLQKITIRTLSSSLVGKKQTSPLFAKLPARPPLQEKKQQTTSVLSDLPARPVFNGFDTPGDKPAPQTSLFAPTASPQMPPPRPTPSSADIVPTTESNIPPTLPIRPVVRPKGTVPPLLPHHQSFNVSQMPLPFSVISGLQNFGTPNSSSHAIGASASFNPPPARANSYFHGSIFHHIPVSQDVPLSPVPYLTPSSFEFNQSIGE